MSFEGALDVFQEKKKQRMAHVVYELWKRNEADLNEFKGSLSVNFGFRSKTLDEYFEDLKNAKMIKINDRRIELLWDKDKTEEWLEKQGILTIRRQAT